MCALMALAGSVAGASPRLIASSVDSGALPIATADGSLDAPQRGPLIELKASPVAPLDLDMGIRCYRGSHNRGADYTPPPSTPPIRRRIRLPMHNPDYCSVDAFASYEELEDADGDFAEGRIRFKIYR
jgi:hypothetical protein